MKQQLSQCITLLKAIFKHDLLGVYLYGSAIVGGLQKYSDIDIFVIINRPSNLEEKRLLVTNLLDISGVYMQSAKLPIEMTMVVKSEINPWQYPPRFDFQYGDWLRKEFEAGITEPWQTKEMPDLAVLITKVLLASNTLFGPSPNQLLCPVPYKDFISATLHSLSNLKADVLSDTRNVLLTYARVWCTLETDSIRSKQAAADWVMPFLPQDLRPALQRAKDICIGEKNETWDDLEMLIQLCAAFMENKIKIKINEIKADNTSHKSISMSK